MRSSKERQGSYIRLRKLHATKLVENAMGKQEGNKIEPRCGLRLAFDTIIVPLSYEQSAGSPELAVLISIYSR